MTELLKIKQGWELIFQKNSIQYLIFFQILYSKNTLYQPNLLAFVNITLDQCYNGCVYPIYIERNVTINNTTEPETETVYVNIPCGINNGETIILWFDLTGQVIEPGTGEILSITYQYIYFAITQS